MADSKRMLIFLVYFFVYFYVCMYVCIHVMEFNYFSSLCVFSAVLVVLSVHVLHLW